MNDELIFVKTSAGEDAVRDRTRLVQRNLRMVLILVDGLTKVSALKQKAGDPAMIETALAELERIGLIESLNTRGERQATFVAEALDFSKRESHLEPTISSGDDADAIVETQDTVFDAMVADASLDADTEIPDLVTPAAKVHARTLEPTMEPKPGLIAGIRNRWYQMREERAYEKAYGTPATGAASVEVPVARPGSYRAPRIKPKRVGFALFLAIVAGGLLGVVFYPYDNFRPGIEKAASRLLGDEVSVRGVRLVLLPTPSLRLDDVRFGSGDDIAVQALSLIPDIRYLMGGRTLFRTATATGIAVREPALSKAHNWFKGTAVGEIGLESVSFKDLTIGLGNKGFHLASGQLTPNFSGGFSLVGVAEGGQLKLDVRPSDTGISITAKSDKWQVPLVPAIPVEAFELQGLLSTGKLQVDKFDMRAFDGLITGAGTLEWGTASSVALAMELKHIATTRLLDAFRAPGLLSGELDASLRYDSATPTIHWLGQKERLEGQISVSRGKLNRVDLAGALRPNLPGGIPQRGGETGFEEFKARVELANNKLTLNGAKLASGLMQASGQATFGLDSGQVSGVAGVEMRGSVRAPRATISIGGKASEPELKAGR